MLKNPDEDSNDGALERAIIQMDHELQEEHDFIDLASNLAQKKKRFNSLGRSAKTQDTEMKQMLEEEESDWTSLTNNFKKY